MFIRTTLAFLMKHSYTLLDIPSHPKFFHCILVSYFLWGSVSNVFSILTCLKSWPSYRTSSSMSCWYYLHCFLSIASAKAVAFFEVDFSLDFPSGWVPWSPKICHSYISDVHCLGRLWREPLGCDQIIPPPVHVCISAGHLWVGSYVQDVQSLVFCEENVCAPELTIVFFFCNFWVLFHFGLLSCCSRITVEDSGEYGLLPSYHLYFLGLFRRSPAYCHINWKWIELFHY